LLADEHETTPTDRPMISDLRSQLETYRERLEELRRFL
jgi:hypothetical protein